ncbi:sugar O-acetyltransferase [Peptacetobacter hominis]|uniref:Sugar O-acetyltransferase n=1 Tax=Peptacetobacter hominis TaxID=2743610 RepID=A0A544QWG2_9FIRM|nr:sugar O-acetyltransferase [Peptacetobacter hominis]
MNSKKEIEAGSDIHKYMGYLAQEALKITVEMNSKYHTPEEVHELMEKLTGRKVGEGFAIFPPFYTDCGKNTFIDKNVFINSGCKFQDQGGITIGEGTLIGHNVVIATLNHNMSPEKRGNMIPAPVQIGKNVWVGSNSTILSGVKIGDGAVIAAGAVVTKDVEKNTVVGGVPAKKIREV